MFLVMWYKRHLKAKRKRELEWAREDGRRQGRYDAREKEIEKAFSEGRAEVEARGRAR